MSNPRFSIVIPTRERADTLRHTLRTCLAQQFDSYEIVISDNCSSPATRETVESFESPKIKYIRSDHPLAMSDNWELAVSHAVGEFVIVIGDDDGLLPHALREIDRLLQDLGGKVLCWEQIHYGWPSVALEELTNSIIIPLASMDLTLQSQEMMLRIANFDNVEWRMLPMIYHSAIHQDLITQLREKTGRVFGAAIPDVYSGFAFAYLARQYTSVGRPMSIRAESQKSTGIALHFVEGNSPAADEFHALNAQARLQYHPRIPAIRALPAAIADSFQRAKDALFPDDASLCLDRKALAINCLRETKTYSEEEWRKSVQAIHDSLSDDAELQRWFDSEYLERPSFQPSGRRQFAWNRGFDGAHLNLDAAQFGVTDVFAAAELIDKVMGYTAQIGASVEATRKRISFQEELEQQIHALMDHTAAQEQALQTLSRELNTIYGSRLWKVAQFYRTQRKRLKFTK